MTKKKHPKPAEAVYQIKVTLQDNDPPIWRSLLVPGDINLERIHEVIQLAFDWTNSHLHQFEAGGRTYGILDDEIDDPEEIEDERCYSLNQVVHRKGAKMLYTYDFGDNWEHLIVVEAISPSVDKQIQPHCLDGANHRPPEDVGGTGGYEHFLEIIKNPKHPEHKEMLEWAGGSFDPEAFSAADVNEDLKRLLDAGSLNKLWGVDEEDLL